jgi:hypothetical protein
LRKHLSAGEEVFVYAGVEVAPLLVGQRHRWSR